MLDLVRFELKKLLVRRTSLIACAGILVMLCGIMALNVAQTRTTSNADEVLTGTAAIAHQKEKAVAHEGVLDADRVREEVAAYLALAFSKVDPADVAGLSDDAAYALMKQAYGEDEFRMLYDPYYVYLFSPWKAGALEPYQVAAQLDDGAADGFYEAIAGKLQRTLDNGMGGTWTYSDAERAYWTEKQDGVGEPLAYGYAGGWSDVLACLGFFAFAMVAVCIALTPVFRGSTKTAPTPCCSRRATAARSWWRRRSSPRSPSPRPTSRWRRSSSWARRSRSSVPRAGTCRCRCCRCPSRTTSRWPRRPGRRWG